MYGRHLIPIKFLLLDEKVVSGKASGVTITVPEHKRKKNCKFEVALSVFPNVEVTHEPEDMTCDKFGAEMVEIGEEKHERRLSSGVRQRS